MYTRLVYCGLGVFFFPENPPLRIALAQLTMSIRLADKDSTHLRFAVGTKVECLCGAWEKGVVTKQFYTQKSFPEGMCVPYQIRLDDCRLIYSPMDEDRVIRKGPEEDLGNAPATASAAAISTTSASTTTHHHKQR